MHLYMITKKRLFTGSDKDRNSPVGSIASRRAPSPCTVLTVGVCSGSLFVTDSNDSGRMALSWMEVTCSVLRENSNAVALGSVPRESSQGNNQHVFTHSEQAVTQPRIKGFSLITFFPSTADASHEL